MKIKHSKLFAIIMLTLIIPNYTTAQISDTIASLCIKNLDDNYISDGQQYRALLRNHEEVAEFSTTLFGGTTYRIAACSGLSDGNLQFNVYDKNKTLLFSNKDYQNAPYWDFDVKNTIDCIIEARLNPKTIKGSGRAVILIGFRP